MVAGRAESTRMSQRAGDGWMDRVPARTHFSGGVGSEYCQAAGDEGKRKVAPAASVRDRGTIA